MVPGEDEAGVAPPRDTAVVGWLVLVGGLLWMLSVGRRAHVYWGFFLAAVLIGAAAGMLFRLISYGINRRNRDFDSFNQVLASNYQVIVDPALVEHRPTDELDIEVAHPERALHGLAGHREDLGQDVVERLLEALVLALAAGFGQVATALEILMVELVVGRFLELRGGAHLIADLGELGTDLVIGQTFELGFEPIGLVHPWLDPLQLAVIRIDETGKETHRTVEYRASRADPRSDAGSRYSE